MPEIPTKIVVTSIELTVRAAIRCAFDSTVQQFINASCLQPKLQQRYYFK